MKPEEMLIESRKQANRGNSCNGWLLLVGANLLQRLDRLIALWEQSEEDWRAVERQARERADALLEKGGSDGDK